MEKIIENTNNLINILNKYNNESNNFHNNEPHNFDNNEINLNLLSELRLLIRENMNYIANHCNHYYLDSNGNIQLNN